MQRYASALIVRHLCGNCYFLCTKLTVTYFASLSYKLSIHKKLEQHIPLQASTASLGQSGLGYTVQTQPAMDGNSVDMDQERANFVDKILTKM